MDRRVQADDNNSTGELAVVIKNVCKSYDKKGPLILNNFSMSVKKGSIYSLLGSSGCGKTTVLSCILGISKWESGEIKVFGKNWESSGRENFVKRVGYVPQEIALYEQLTIKENIRFYGALYGIHENTLLEQWMLLKNLLMLPAGTKFASGLSGGQKRRVSLALSLVHQPELLILDEPTVGLDPLLRERVWDYLFSLAQNKGTSIIITTHYMEETKKSDVIGVMRHGTLFVEDSPAKLLANYNNEFLEDIILTLIKNSSDSICIPSTSSSGSAHAQNNGTNVNNFSATKNRVLSLKSKGKFELTPSKVMGSDSTFHSQGTYTNTTFDSYEYDYVNTTKTILKRRDSEDVTNIFKRSFSFWRKSLATSVVIWLTFIRHPMFFIFTLLLPAYEVLLTFACLGRDPKGLSIAVVNDEIPDWQTKCYADVEQTQILDNLTGYTFTDFSCWYLQHLGSDDVIKMVPSNNTIEAKKGVHNGDFWGYIHFPANFSQQSIDRFTAHRFATEESINGSTFDVRLDMSGFIGSITIIKRLCEQLFEYFNHLGNYLNVSTSIVDLPLIFKKPVYGSESNGYYDHYVPAVLTNVLFFVPLSSAALVFIGELKTGTFKRAQVAGRTIGEIITAHLVSQLLMIFVQIVICTLCMKFAYSYYVFGSLILYAFVSLVIGICGTIIGIFLGLVIQDEFEALILTVFFALTALISGGVIWPLACAQPLWRHFGNVLPITLIIESLRSVIVRGIGITHELVWPGLTYTFGWIVVVWILVVFFSKRLIK